MTASSTFSDKPRGLHAFEGKGVISAGMEIPGAAGGLREPLHADPVELHLDDEVYVVMHLRTNKVRFDPIKDSDLLTRVHVMEVLEATFVDGDLVDDRLRQQSERLREARRAEKERKGIQELPLDDKPAPEPPVAESGALAEHQKHAADDTYAEGCAYCLAIQRAREMGESDDIDDILGHDRGDDEDEIIRIGDSRPIPGVAEPVAAE